MNDNKAHYDLYVMAESKYVNSHKDLEKSSLFPEDWYSSDNYYLKNKILAEAIMNNVLISETKGYEEFQEHVITK